jgi:hypothetical protein
VLLFKIGIAKLKIRIKRLKIYSVRRLSFLTYLVKSKITKKIAYTALGINRYITKYFKR